MRERPVRPQWPLTVVLIVVNVVCYVAQLVLEQGGGGRLLAYLPLFPRHLARGYVWELLTFQFLHASVLHLLLNCVVLYLFGRFVEDILGRNRFLWLYLGSGAFGGLVQAAFGLAWPRHFGQGPVVGASAGVFAMVAAFAAMNWEQPITTYIYFIIPVTLRAKYLILGEIIFAGICLLEPYSGIAHGAHLGGILAGLAYIQYGVQGRPRLFQWPRLRASVNRAELVGASAAKGRVWKTQGPPIPDDLPPAEFISREVDPILDKISAHGIQSLTDRERRILEAARAKMGDR